jgi:predicted XRE-type DNA-binding protein
MAVTKSLRSGRKPARPQQSVKPVRGTAKKKAATVRFEASTGNVFADMGARDADERLAKAELARIVRSLVRERQASEGWTQARAAAALGIKAPDMSNLMRGKLAGFSQERLAHFLTQLGMDVRIQVAPRSADRAQATISVERVAAFA